MVETSVGLSFWITPLLRRPSADGGDLHDVGSCNDVQLSGEVYAERLDRTRRKAPVLLVDRDTVLKSEAPQKSCAVVGIEVVAANRRNRAPAIHVAAGDRARRTMPVVDDGRLEPCRRAGRSVVAAETFPDVPPEIE